LPLVAIRPEGWLRDELSRMVNGMTGNLDEWYPEICGQRNAWLGHANSDMIRHYYHLHDEEAQRQIQQLNFLGVAGGCSTSDKEGIQ
jgi:hypothetical protein